MPQISAFITNFRGVIQLPFFNWFCLVVGEDPQGKWIPGIKDMRNSFKSNKILHKEGGAEKLETIKAKRMAEYYFEWNKVTKVTWNDMVFRKNIFSHETMKHHQLVDLKCLKSLIFGVSHLCSFEVWRSNEIFNVSGKDSNGGGFKKWYSSIQAQTINHSKQKNIRFHCQDTPKATSLLISTKRFRCCWSLADKSSSWFFCPGNLRWLQK